MGSDDGISELQQSYLKDCWEDLTEHDIEALGNHGKLEVRLMHEEERWVPTTWFNAIRGTPLHKILFDRRWGGVRGALNCQAETFDDICNFLCSGQLPSEHPRRKRAHLRRAADFYCLHTLLEALDMQEARERIARERAEKERVAAKASAERRHRRSMYADRKSKGEEAEFMAAYVESWSERCSTKAQNIKNVAKVVQHACCDGGPRNHNRQRVYLTKNAKRNRFHA